jgi:hypothetical protein
MPLGFIHLIASETETGAGAIYFCGIETAIAAINPSRLNGFPVEMICPQCFQAFETTGEQQADSNGPDG